MVPKELLEKVFSPYSPQTPRPEAVSWLVIGLKAIRRAIDGIRVEGDGRLGKLFEEVGGEIAFHLHTQVLFYGFAVLWFSPDGPRVLPSAAVSVVDGRYVVHRPEGALSVDPGECVVLSDVSPADLATPLRVLREAMGDSLSALVALERYTAAYLHNDTVPPVLVSVDQPLTDEQEVTLLQRLFRRHGGPERAGRVGIISGGNARVQAVGATIDQVRAIDLEERLQEKILALLGVPPAIVGVYRYANYANSREQTKLFYQNTVFPAVRAVEERVNRYLARVRGGSVDYRIEDTPVYAEITADRIERLTVAAQGLWAMGVDTDVALEVVGLGDRIREARERLGGKEPQKTVHVVRGVDEGSFLENSKAAFLRLHQRVESAGVRAVYNAMIAIRNEILETIERGSKSVYDEALAAENWARYQQELEVALAGVLMRGGESLWPDLDRFLVGYVPSEDMPEWYAAVLRSAINDNKVSYAVETLRNDLRQVIADGLSRGSTPDEIAAAIKDTFGKDRALRIVRTESTRYLNETIRRVAVEEGYTQKRWSTAKDEKVRPTHQAAEGAGWVGVSDAFPNGLLVPGDPSAPASETVNCRCTVIYRGA